MFTKTTYNLEQISLIIFFEVVERKSAQPAYAFRLQYIFFGKRSRSSQDETRCSNGQTSIVQ